MTIHKTDKWIKDFIQQRKQDRVTSTSLHQTIICEPLTDYFHFTPKEVIQEHLWQHGLFSPKISDSDAEKWLKQDYLTKVRVLYHKCRTTWNGPETEIFILPSNEEIKELKEWFNSNAGLSFPDKLFIFLNKQASNREIAALFLHEYSHVCRLNLFPKDEVEYNLLDAIILEGIAEWIVRKKVGKEYGNKRIKELSDNSLQALWKKWAAPHLGITRDHPKHDMIMYGGRRPPKNTGYIIGYNIVKRYMKEQQCSIRTLLGTPNERIVETCSFLHN
ncbi:DUF2268 domain-containing putative Zn-dependent protease [Gracilibacillus sp. S3-1-1]|uniref:DUF2268 domain-containing putative Zn-dependent protease n=1 Tax=Gracilibacillus pellucidus TaxID=3095368 RepID=A0ACC6M3A8_9BACI|nr:DUF2268 domain-containing putative Zn-dependent protease [Gracilibacillus sp. S3-1-1]MDX8045222.1 DUF2268 domain-containing putative Zn-dependent protease [Gracilibacillus sp. S3-1-1]